MAVEPAGRGFADMCAKRRMEEQRDDGSELPGAGANDATGAQPSPGSTSHGTRVCHLPVRLPAGRAPRVETPELQPIRGRSG